MKRLEFSTAGRALSLASMTALLDLGFPPWVMKRPSAGRFQSTVADRPTPVARAELSIFYIADTGTISPRPERIVTALHRHSVRELLFPLNRSETRLFAQGVHGRVGHHNLQARVTQPERRLEPLERFRPIASLSIDRFPN